ncbi:unnamed protein product [Rangifer tarandus platyrhynchus]|uniref:Uncharacterized protein n=1 Tax=Rangifer tarandus platyrhynchus TaxID=3082113 RepID=A0ABN8Y138_RANTA|nr:unnamed protein product [Rangifer tarandus platyrhynchus]
MGKLRPRPTPHRRPQLRGGSGQSRDQPPPWLEERGAETGLASGLQGQRKGRVRWGQTARLGEGGGGLREEKDKRVSAARKEGLTVPALSSSAPNRKRPVVG